MGSSPPDPVLSGAPACVPPAPLASVAPSLPAHPSPATASGKPHFSPLGSVHYPRCPPSGWVLHVRAVVVPSGQPVKPFFNRSEGATLGGHSTSGRYYRFLMYVRLRISDALHKKLAV